MRVCESVDKDTAYSLSLCVYICMYDCCIYPYLDRVRVIVRVSLLTKI